jgi:hypothetical protein
MADSGAGTLDAGSRLGRTCPQPVTGSQARARAGFDGSLDAFLEHRPGPDRFEHPKPGSSSLGRQPTRRDTAMAAKEFLLTLPELMGERIRLVNPCYVGREPTGEPILLNTLDPRSFGRSFIAQAGPDLLWHARTEVKSLDRLKDLHGFHSGAIVSPRAKDIIESENIPNIEFIPVAIRYMDTDTMLGTWWFVNVFNWRAVFDLQRSKVKYVDFYEPITGTRQISRRFGEKLIAEWDILEANKEATGDGLFLAEAPTEKIWNRIFISRHLAERLNEGLPKDRRISFPQFWLDRGPGPQFDLSGYRYAGS